MMASFSFVVSIKGAPGSKAASVGVLGYLELEAIEPWQLGRGEESPQNYSKVMQICLISVIYMY